MSGKTQTRDGWPELTYKYVEHYFWEPQHLVRTPSSKAAARTRGERGVDAVHRHLRTTEVPLNYLLNVLLRLVPASVRRASLGAFGVETGAAHLGALTLRTPHAHSYIQPDVHLESDTKRVFIELKVDAPLKLAQVKKYLRLHEELDGATSKCGYVLFLVKTKELALSDVKRRFAHTRVDAELRALPELQDAKVRFGSATWETFATTLAQLVSDAKRDAEAAEMLQVLVGDFLIDLSARKLVPSP